MTIDSAILTPLDSASGYAYSVWGDGDFVYVADGGYTIKSYSVDASGNLTLEDSVPTGDFYPWSVWGDGRFVYLLSWDEVEEDGILQSYTVDVAGDLTLVDTYRMVGFGWIAGLHGDDNFLYVAADADGLLSFSVDGAGDISHIDTDTTPTCANCVWSDGTFVYVGDDNGLMTYSVDGAGNLTYLHIGSIDNGISSICGDGTYVYTAEWAAGFYVYSVDQYGNVNYVNNHDPGGAGTCYGVWTGGDGLLYVGHAQHVYVYSVSAGGVLTQLDSSATTNAYLVWGDGTFIYVADASDGLLSFSVRVAFSFTLDIIASLYVGSGIGLVNSLNAQLASNIDLKLSILQSLAANFGIKMTIEELAKFNNTLDLLNHIFDASSGVTVGGTATVIESYVDPGGYVTPSGIYDSEGDVIVAPGATVPVNTTIPAGATVTGGFYFAKRHGL